MADRIIGMGQAFIELGKLTSPSPRTRVGIREEEWHRRMSLSLQVRDCSSAKSWGRRDSLHLRVEDWESRNKRSDLLLPRVNAMRIDQPDET
jgi:hypothetical protein